MPLSDLHVLHGPKAPIVVIKGSDSRRSVVAYIPFRHLEDYFNLPTGLSNQQADLLVEDHSHAFGRIIEEKYARGEYKSYGRYGSTLACILITIEDIVSSGELMSEGVLESQHVWA
jgi:hypothetical protein